MEFHDIYNYIEILIWGIIGIIFSIQCIRLPAYRKQAMIATITFLLMAVSEVVETRTGAWWRPWWLFVWKVSCGISMFALLYHHSKQKDNHED